MSPLEKIWRISVQHIDITIKICIFGLKNKKLRFQPVTDLFQGAPYCVPQVPLMRFGGRGGENLPYHFLPWGDDIVPQPIVNFRLFQVLLMWLLALFGLMGCQEQSSIPEPPLKIPFSLDKNGEIADFQVRITEKHAYGFSLKFMVNENDPGDGRHLRKLVGDGSTATENKLGADLLERRSRKIKPPATGGNPTWPEGSMGVVPKESHPSKFLNLGIPLTIRLHVRSLNKNNLFVFDKTISEIPVCCSGSDAITKRVAIILLEPGIYYVRADNLLSAPEFAGRSIFFSITLAHHGK